VLRTDKYELDTKIHNLEHLIHQEIFKQFSLHRKSILLDQLYAMRQYSECLRKLIDINQAEKKTDGKI
jgi:hypothetical protein